MFFQSSGVWKSEIQVLTELALSVGSKGESIFLASLPASGGGLIKKEIKICIEMNEDENTTTQNLCYQPPHPPLFLTAIFIISSFFLLLFLSK